MSILASEKASTTTQLLDSINDWYEAISNKLKVDIICIDFAKAFDSISHDLLLHNLSQIGVTGKVHTFIRNFLTGRTFRVKIGNSYSDPFPINSGVP